MWPRSLIYLATFGSVVYGQVADLGSAPRNSTDQPLANSYIVELTPGGSLSKRDLHEEFASELNKRGVSWTLQASFTNKDIFSGAALTVKSKNDLVAIAALDSVIGIWPNYIRYGPQINLEFKPSGPNDPQLNPDIVPAHKMTGIDRLQAQGWTGKGIQVAVIDSGVDYNLPVLGGGFGRGKKVYTGYDFVGDAFTGSNTPIPDSDPLDTCDGHGTAVASLIAGNLDSTYGFKGAAPDAQIAAYRVFSCTSASTDAIIVQAILKAYTDGNDVINLSLSENTGWSENVLSIMADRIAKKGRIVVGAAGNNGVYGPFYASGPGTGASVINVASVDADKFILQVAIPSDGHAKIPYLANSILPINGALPIWVPADLTGCAPFTNPPDLTKYIVIVQRGACSIPQKTGNVAAAGGKYMLLSNNVPGYQIVAFGTSGIVYGLISMEDGAYLVSQFQAGKTVKLAFPKGLTVTVPITTGGLVTPTSSWGPTFEMAFKPNVGGVGGNVFTAWPAALGSWAVNSGTSLSAPLVAGASALLLQAKGPNPIVGTIISLAAKSLFEQTANPAYNVMGDSSSGSPSFARQGAGLINAYDAVNYKTFISPSLLELNDTANSDYSQTVWIQNWSSKTQTYKLSHVPADTVQTFSANQVNPNPIVAKAVASAKFSKQSVTVWPLLPTAVTVTFTAPKGLDPSTFPVFSGQILFTSDTEQVAASYMGMAANMKDMPVLDTGSSYFGVALPIVLEATGGNVQTGPRNYTFVGSDYPLMYYRLTAGTPSLRIDLVSANINFTPSTKRDLLQVRDGEAPSSSLPIHRPRTGAAHRDAVRHARQIIESRKEAKVEEERSLDAPQPRRRGILSDLFGWWTPPKSLPGSSTNTFAKVPTLGVLQQSTYVNRHNNDVPANGGLGIYSLLNLKFANGTAIPNGSYRILLRALEITGNPTDQNDYESWLSPVINVAKAPSS